MLCLIIAFLEFSQQFYIKHYTKNSFLCQSDPSLGSLFITKCSQDRSIDFNIEKNETGSGFFTQSSKEQLVLTVNSDKQITLEKKRGDASQQFQLSYIGPDKYIITNSGGCMTAENDSKHSMRPCNFELNQIYSVVHNTTEKKSLTVSSNAHVYANLNGPQLYLLDKINQEMHEGRPRNPLLENEHPHQHYRHSHGHNQDLHNEHRSVHNLMDRTGDYLTNYDDHHHHTHEVLSHHTDDHEPEHNVGHHGETYHNSQRHSYQKPRIGFLGVFY